MIASCSPGTALLPRSHSLSQDEPLNGLPPVQVATLAICYFTAASACPRTEVLCNVLQTIMSPIYVAAVAGNVHSKLHAFFNFTPSSSVRGFALVKRNLLLSTKVIKWQGILLINLSIWARLDPEIYKR